jgi:hypothetical protein
MAQITITIGDQRLSDVLDYIARAKGYTGTDPDGQPETRAQFARRMIVEQLHIWVAIGRKQEAEEQINDRTLRQTFGIT